VLLVVGAEGCSSTLTRFTEATAKFLCLVVSTKLLRSGADVLLRCVLNFSDTTLRRIEFRITPEDITNSQQKTQDSLLPD
jgi:hypothetical protein